MAVEDGGWAHHAGGECPTGLEDVAVWVRIRDYSEIEPRLGRYWRWEHRGTAGDIIAYRVLGADMTTVDVDREAA